MKDIEQIHVDVAEVCIFGRSSVEYAVLELTGKDSRGGAEWRQALPDFSYAEADVRAAIRSLGGAPALSLLCKIDTRGCSNADIIQRALKLDLKPRLRAAVERIVAEMLL